MMMVNGLDRGKETHNFNYTLSKDDLIFKLRIARSLRILSTLRRDGNVRKFQIPCNGIMITAAMLSCCHLRQ